MTRETVIELIDRHGAAAARRQGIHNQAGALTFTQIATKVVDHLAHHDAQIRQALGAK